MKILEKLHIPTDNVNDDEVIIKNIYVSNNDEVKEKTILLDYETSKANFEIESNVSGYVTILCEENDTVKVGQEIIVITDENDFSDAITKEVIIPDTAIAPTIDFSYNHLEYVFF